MSTLIYRKLSPFLTPPPYLLSPCLHFCDPSCTNFNQDCFLLPDPIFNPPDPSPLPLPPHKGFHIPNVVIAIVCLLVVILLVISYLAVSVKRKTRPRPGTPIPGQSETDDEWVDPDSMLLNPIWLISTVGLHQSVINTITRIYYKKDEGLIEGRDCSVCLSEFQEGESLRLLPKCDHAFHIDCIDTWLRSHTNCPLCRAAVVVNLGRVSPDLDSDGQIDDVELGSSSLTGDGSVVSENGGEGETEHCEYDIENGRKKTGVGRSVSMDFCFGQNSRNVDDPGLQRNAKWSSFRMIGTSSSSSWRAVGCSSNVKRSYSWGEKIFGSGRVDIRSGVRIHKVHPRLVFGSS